MALPNDGSFIVVANSVDIPQGRQIAPGLGIQIGDTGPLGFIVISVDDFVGSLQNIGSDGPSGFLCQTTTNTAASRTLASDASILITNPAGVAGNPSLSVVANSTVQKIIVGLSGSAQSTASGLNFVPGTGIGITAVSSSFGTDVTISSTLAASPTLGTLLLGNGSAFVALPIGSASQVLKVSGGTAVWSSDTGFTNPMTNAGDMIYGGVSGVATRLPIGTAGQVLKVSGGNPVWSSDTGFANPMTTLGDIMIAGALGAPTRLAIGSAGQGLIVTAGSPAWGAIAPGNATYITQTASGGLTNEQVLGSLATGILKNTTTTGVLSIASPNGDYYSSATMLGVFINTLTVGGAAQALYAFYANAGGSSASFAMDTSTQAVPVPNVGIISMNNSKVLHFTNNVADYAVAFGLAATGSIPLGSSGAYSDLTIGSSGTALLSNGTTAAWGAIAPLNATYIVQTANGTLTNEQALGALSTGILKNTTTTGVLSIAASGTDYYAPGTTNITFTATSVPTAPAVWVDSTLRKLNYVAPAYTPAVADMSGVVVTANASNTTDATCGKATLTNGTAFISTRSVQTNSIIICNYGTQSGGTYGTLSVLESAIGANTQFRVDSRSAVGVIVAADQSNFYWQIINPS